MGCERGEDLRGLLMLLIIDGEINKIKDAGLGLGSLWDVGDPRPLEESLDQQNIIALAFSRGEEGREVSRVLDKFASAESCGFYSYSIRPWS